MRRSSIIFNFLGAVGLVGLLGGCGSGGAPSGPASGSASGSAASSGTITGFGSVFVNGKKFEANGVEVRRDDGTTNRCDISPANHCGLKQGMTVLVSGSFNGNEHTADSVQQKDAVEGLVQSIAADGLSLVVMGQTVLLDNTTIFDNNFIPVVGDNVEVNGHIRPNGVIQATFIEKKIAGVTPEVRGFISGHLAGTTTFQIGTLTVNYAGVIITDMPSPSGSNWNDLFVEVKGTAFNSGTTTLTATEVEPENRAVQQVDEFEVEGFVTQIDVDGSGDFFIGSTRVHTTANTEFRGGTIDEIVMGEKLSAEGGLANGILTAKHVKFHASVKLEGNVAAVDPAANTFMITGLPGVTVNVNSQTEFRTNGGNTITVQLVGVHVRVRGRVGSSNSVIATRVEERSAGDDVDLQGPVQEAADPGMRILDVTVNTEGILENNFKGLNDATIGRVAFFKNAVEVGTLVKVKGRLNGVVVTWREAELEN